MTTHISKTKRVIRAVFRLGILLAFIVLAFKGCDRALLQQDYKTCLQIPKEVRSERLGNCEQFNPDK